MTTGAVVQATIDVDSCTFCIYPKEDPEKIEEEDWIVEIDD